mmetsp:Transcript_27165/g.79128  ORF Transcript_27165/g.79128 Transcript_27165/m.79128 type:complete len:218 (-) Transcript_27165:1297-1950(-)
MDLAGLLCEELLPLLQVPPQVLHLAIGIGELLLQVCDLGPGCSKLILGGRCCGIHSLSELVAFLLESLVGGFQFSELAPHQLRLLPRQSRIGAGRLEGLLQFLVRVVHRILACLWRRRRLAGPVFHVKDGPKFGSLLACELELAQEVGVCFPLLCQSRLALAQLPPKLLDSLPERSLAAESLSEPKITSHAPRQLQSAATQVVSVLSVDGARVASEG